MTIREARDQHRHAEPVVIRRAVRGAAIGNTVEWFDFAIYGFLATYIADKFFPSGDETAALLNTFAIFAAAFFMRLTPLWTLLMKGSPSMRAKSS